MKLLIIIVFKSQGSISQWNVPVDKIAVADLFLLQDIESWKDVWSGDRSEVCGTIEDCTLVSQQGSRTFYVFPTKMLKKFGEGFHFRKEKYRYTFSDHRNNSNLNTHHIIAATPNISLCSVPVFVRRKNNCKILSANNTFCATWLFSWQI